MNRVDMKFVFHQKCLHELLEKARQHYEVLKIKDTVVCAYDTTYYDTNGFCMYTMHHNGKTNRYKVRVRKYVDTNTEFVEVKFKNNKSKTLKSRLKRIQNGNPLTTGELSFIEEKTPFSANGLSPVIRNQFNRITLVSRENKQRITIDTGLLFNYNGGSYTFDNLVILEVKKEPGNYMTPIEQLLRELRIKPLRVSKYCLGTYLLNNGVKHNLFKQKIRDINKTLAS